MTRILAALTMTLLTASSAMAHWGHYSVAVAIPVAPPVVAYPVPAVTYYAPAAPLAYSVPYAMPTPAVTYYAAPPAPVVYPAAPVLAPAPLAYVPGRYSVKFYPYGQPVRNVVRAVLP